MNKSFFLILFLISSSVFANDYFCTKWTRVSGTTCIFGGRSADLWARQCENPCNYRNYNPQCDVDRICHTEDPNTFVSACSAWIRESGVTCHNPNTSRWEQKWIRACQNGLVTSWCSDLNPN